MIKPIISIVVCTYNRSHLLVKCLESLINQKVDKNIYEVIVIDNNSTDDTQEIGNDYAKNQPNIRIVTEKSQGRNQARNRGWQDAKGKYVAYIDDDAIAEPYWIKQIAVFIKKYPKINAFGGPYNAFSVKPFPDWFPENYGTLNLGNKVKILNPENEWISGSNIIFNRIIFDKYGGFNTDFGGKGDNIIYGDETEFLVRLKKAKEPVYYVPKICIRHLVAERKLHLWWLLKSDYLHNFSCSLIFKGRSDLLKGLLSLITSFFIFPLCLLNNKESPFKRRVYFGLSKIFSALGRISGSIESIFK